MTWILALLLALLAVPCSTAQTININGTAQHHMGISLTGQQYGPECNDIVILSEAKPNQQSMLICKSNIPYKITAETIPQVGDPANILVSCLPQSAKIMSLCHDMPLSACKEKTEVLLGRPTLNRGEDCVLDYRLPPENSLLYGESVVAIVRYRIEPSCF